MELVLRATAVYWFLWLVTRGTGKRSLAELTPLDLLAVVVLGDFVQQGVTQEDMSVTGALIAVSTFTLWTFAASALSRRSQKVRSLVAGEPVVVLRAGRPLVDRLRLEGLALDDLEEAARAAGYGDLGEIAVAVLETDGRLSFIPDRPAAPPAGEGGG
jgi:uncharacterized membrane protein YcaP (DUF421 family)